MFEHVYESYPERDTNVYTGQLTDTMERLMTGKKKGEQSSDAPLPFNWPL